LKNPNLLPTFDKRKLQNKTTRACCSAPRQNQPFTSTGAGTVQGQFAASNCK